jgi:succinyl-diaminopimelate desuccinylase
MSINDEKIVRKIEQLEQDAVGLMQGLIKINSVGPKNDGPGEGEKAKFLREYLSQAGFKNIVDYPASDSMVAEGQRPNLVTTLEGKNSDRTLWIISHMDVVPPGDLSKWHSDPWDPILKEGKIFGRGSEDNLQGLVSSIMMARAFIDSDIQPEVNIGLALVSDEETGSAFGLAHLLNNHAELFKNDDLIIIPDAGEPDGSLIEVAEKSILWIKFKTLGRQVHASVPHQGINAFRAAAHLVVQLERLPQIFNARDEVFEPPLSTFEPTKKETNVPNINTLPGDDVFFYDCRILPQYDIHDILKTVGEIAREIEERFKVKIEITTEQEEQAAPATSVQAPVVQALKKAIKTVHRIDARPQGIGGGTVAAVFRRKGFPVAVWSTIDDLAHQPNEYCKISNLVNDTKVFALCALEEF